jgi:hypothetical protein
MTRSAERVRSGDERTRTPQCLNMLLPENPDID